MPTCVEAAAHLLTTMLPISRSGSGPTGAMAEVVEALDVMVELGRVVANLTVAPSGAPPSALWSRAA